MFLLTKLVFHRYTSCSIAKWSQKSDDVGFNPSTQRHYHRLIYYLYIHSYMFRSYDHHQVEKYITTLGLLFFSLMMVVRPKHVAVYI
jgi:hypothetical protein